MIPNTNHNLVLFTIDLNKRLWLTPIVGWIVHGEGILYPVSVTDSDLDDLGNGNRSYTVLDKSTARLYLPEVYSGIPAIEEFPEIADQLKELLDQE